MKHFPDLNAIVPPVTLIVPEGKPEPEPQKARTKQRIHPEQIDIRLPIVHEFLRSSNLEANSRRLYERELKQFMAWAIDGVGLAVDDKDGGVPSELL